MNHIIKRLDAGMSANQSRTPKHYVSEGHYHAREQREQAVRLSTSTAPIVREPDTNYHGVTGHLKLPTMSTEGTDRKGKDPESAPKASDETMPSIPVARMAEEAKANAEASEKKPHILIIEDSAELAEVIQATLESAGMNAISVSHGAKGLEHIKANSPDLLLLDIGLPDMTGWKMLEELREWKKEKNDDMPTVIVITAYGDPANRLIGKLQGIHSYLIKPFTSDEVEKVVRGALSNAG
jgi:CheY-like chemotaxis protein